MQVCYLTTPAQIFHVLRRQVMRKYRKPLIVMTPKSLLRYRPSFSPLSDILENDFQRVLDDSLIDPAQIKRVLLCSGKIYYDLLKERETREIIDTALIRVEQLYPFPDLEIQTILSRYPSAAEYSWVQDEPKNMGAWTFLRDRIAKTVGITYESLQYIGRKASASPATGSKDAHELELKRILEAAFTPQ